MKKTGDTIMTEKSEKQNQRVLQQTNSDTTLKWLTEKYR